MADKKITGLPELTAVAADDYLEIVDTSTNTNKKIQYENLVPAVAWQDYTPTVWASIGSITSYTSSGRYCRIGKAVVCNFAINITDNGTGTGSINVTLPVALSGIAVGVGRENVNTGKMVQLYARGTSIVIFTYDGSYPVATNSVLYCSITYEAA